jgi:hypothetical protein
MKNGVGAVSRWPMKLNMNTTFETNNSTTLFEYSAMETVTLINRFLNLIDDNGYYYEFRISDTENGYTGSLRIFRETTTYYYVAHKFMREFYATRLTARYVLMDRLLVNLNIVNAEIQSNYKLECKELYNKNIHSNKIQQFKDNFKFNKPKPLPVNIKKNRRYLKNNIDSQIQISFNDYLKSFNSTVVADAAVGSIPYVGTPMLISRHVNKLSDKASLTFDTVNSMLASVNTIFDPIKQLLPSANWLVDLRRLFTSLVNVYFAAPGKKIASFILNLTNFALDCGLTWDHFASLFSSKPSNDDELKLINDLTSDFEIQIDASDFTCVTSLLEKSQLAASGLIVILFSICYKITGKFFDIKSAISFLGKLGKDLSGVKTLKNLLSETSTSVMAWFKGDMLGMNDATELQSVIANISVWFDEVRALIVRVNDKTSSDKVLEDPQYLLYVEDLYRRGLEFSIEMSSKKLSERVRFPFEQHMKLLTEIFKRCETSGAFGNKPRISPLIVWMFGASGVGKSGASWPLAIDLNNVLMRDASDEERRNFSKHIYFRNVEQEFWDGYNNQNVVVYDDFGQAKDSQTAPNTEFFEIIRTANISPYPLHMAHIEEKRKAKFTSKVGLLSSNEDTLNVQSLTHPDAVNRRVDIKAEVVVLPQFAKTVFSSAAGGMVTRLDTIKVRKAFGNNVPIATQVYAFKIYNTDSGVPTGEILNYTEFKNRCIALLEDRLFYSHNLNTYLEDYALGNNVDKNVPCLDVKEAFSHFTQLGLIEEEIPELVVGTIQVDSDEYEELEREQFKLTLINKKKIYNLDHMDITSDLLQSVNFASLDLFIDYMYKKHVKIFVRVPFQVKILEAQKKTFLDEIKSVYDKMYKFATEHPMVAVLSVLGGVVAAFALVGGWNWLFGDEEDDDECDIPNVNSCPININDAYILKSFDKNKIVNSKHKHIVVSSISSDDLEIIKTDESLKEKLFHIPKTVLEANVSGDNVTRKIPIVKLESNPSGDNVTRKIPIVKLEANVSGDNLTRQKPAVKIESAVEVDAEIQLWKDTTAQLLINNRVLANLYRVVGVKDDKSSELLNCLFIRGNVALVPTHLKSVLFMYDSLVLINSFNVRYTIPISSLEFVDITDSQERSKEASLMYVNSKYIAMHCDLVKHFQTSFEMGKWKAADVAMPTLRYSDKLGLMVPSILGNTECHALDNAITITDNSKPTILSSIILREGLTYSLNTRVGDCGSPIVVNETQVLRKICGIHNAGSKDGKCYGESVTQMDLLRALKKVPGQLQIILDADMFKGACFNIDINPDNLTKVVPSLKFNPLSVCTNPPSSASKSELRHSAILGTLCKPSTKPAHLRPILINNELVDIKRKNLAKAAMDTPFISREEVKSAAFPVKQKLLANRIPALTRILNFEEAITGSDDSQYMEPINRSSSPGYPWINDRNKSSKGKQQWLGSDEYIFSEEVKKACEYRIKLAKKGMRAPTVWVDTLKDERRPIAKVDEGKTRVFANGPMDFTIVFRQYFLGFMAHVMENRIFNEQSIGTNTWSTDWSRTAKYLQRKGKKVIAGDFSTFDGTLNSCIVGNFIDDVNEYYDDGPENALIRQVLFSEIFNSIHLFSPDPSDCAAIFYMWTHSQPSGCPITTPLNSYYNSVSMRVVYNRLCEPRKDKLLHFLHETRTDNFKGFAKYVFDNTPLKSSFLNKDKIFETKLGNGQIVVNIRTNSKNCFQDLINFCASHPDTSYFAPLLGTGLFKRDRDELNSTLDNIFHLYNVKISIDEDIILLPRIFKNKFDEYCSMVSYGDDNVINISDDIIEWFNQQTITKGYATIGMIYTDEAKTNGLPPKFRNIDEVKYLKRQFVYNKNRGVWDAPLDLDTIKEMTNWIRGDLDAKASTLENCSNAIRELSNHDADTFEQLTLLINKACLSNCMELPSQMSYNDFWEERLINYFT